MKREVCLHGCRYVQLEFEKLSGPFGRSFTPENGYFLTVERMGHGAMQIDVSDPALTDALKKAAIHDVLVEALKAAKFKIECDYVDPQNLAVIKKCEAALKLAGEV